VTTNPTIAFVMEQTLGSVTHYLNLRREEREAAGFNLRWVPIEFAKGRLPWTLTGSVLTRRALKPQLPELRGCFIHTTTIAMLLHDHFRRMPTVLSSDGTPLNKRGMRAAYNLAPEHVLLGNAKRAIYRDVFRRAAGFVAWSNWTKESFVNDYGCREEDVAVIPPGIELEDFSPGDRSHELPRILFVGGDFVRKGGDLLLEVFRKRLRGRAELVLVTRDQVPEEPGVHVHLNVNANSAKLRALYSTCDIFALPTRADCYSLVCMEALAAGMPLVATRVGGIPDMIREGVTGHVVEADDPDALGDALERLVTDRALRERMGTAGRGEALLRFDSKANARSLFDFVRSRCSG
jgi:glycosyltransferase involved in cell wall biosynthesis